MKPRLLDLFARAQGTSVGYARAGFTVTASDIDTYRRHPEVGEFITADALEVLDDVAFCRSFDAIAASPPCQGYSVSLNFATAKGAPRLITPVREKLERIGRPYVIENVEGARSEMRSPLLLCGTMFGLGATDRYGERRQLQRHRLFESTAAVPEPEGGCSHTLPCIGVYGHGGSGEGVRGYAGRKSESVEAMGIDWMRRDDLSQAIPPVYTQWIGWWLRRSL